MLDSKFPRGNGLGASEIGAVVGLNRYQTPHDIWMLKTGRREPFKGNFHTQRGNFLEPAIFNWHAHIYAKKPRSPGYSLKLNLKGGGPKQQTFHADDSICFATPDFFEVDAKGTIRAPGDIKSPGFYGGKDWFDDDGEPRFPDLYLAQCAWQAIALGKDAKVDRYLLTGLVNGRLETRSEPRSLEFEETLLEIGERFWRDYVEKDVPPPVKGGLPATTAWLSEYFDGPTGKMLGPDDLPNSEVEKIHGWIVHAEDLRSEIKELSEEAEEAKNCLRSIVGDNEGYEDSACKVTWKRNKSSKKTDWKALSEELLSRLGKDEVFEVLAKFTEEVPGPRVLRLRMKDDE